MIVESESKNKSNNSNSCRPLTPEEEARLERFADPGAEQFSWSDTFQEYLLGALLTDTKLATSVLPRLEPACFGNETHMLVAKFLKGYWSKYKTLPDRFVIEQELLDQIADRETSVKIHYQAQLATIYDFFVPGLHTHEYLLDKAIDFVKNQTLKLAISKYYLNCEEKPKKVDDHIKKIIAAFQDIIQKDKSGPKIIGCADLLALPDGEWLIENHFPTDSTGLIYGKWASLKTFFALEAALSVACGRLFLGVHPVRSGSVVYIAGEGQTGLKKRVAAWLQHHKVDPPETFHMIFHRFNFADPSEASNLLGLVQEAGLDPVLVVVDTLARNMVGSENDAETMAAFVRSMDCIRDGLSKPHVLTVHHAGKDQSRGSRGYSSLPAAVDVSFELIRKGEGCEIRCEKQKDAEEIDAYTLATVKVNLGLDSKGLPLSSLVLVPDPGEQPSAIQIKLHEERQEEEDVLACIPWLTEQEWKNEPTQSATIPKVTKELGWERTKVKRVFDRLENACELLRWRKLESKKTSPKYYWRDSHCQGKINTG